MGLSHFQRRVPYITAVFGLVFAIIFLHELITINQIIAISIMIFGIHLMYSHERKDEILLK